MKKRFIPREPRQISDEFHRQTSIVRFPKNPLPHDKWPQSWLKVNYKEYLRFKKISFIPNDVGRLNTTLGEALLSRRSARKYQKKRISLKSLGKVLFLSAGINYREGEFVARRSWPSAGARYPLEIYIIPNRIGKLEKYSYHFNVKRNYLERLFPFKDFTELVRQFTGEAWACHSGALIIISAVFDRTRIKYGDRGYRYCLIDSGHLGQNIYLTTYSLNIKCCAIGGFMEKRINDYLELDGISESAIYVLAIGK